MDRVRKSSDPVVKREPPPPPTRLAPRRITEANKVRVPPIRPEIPSAAGASSEVHPGAPRLSVTASDEPPPPPPPDDLPDPDLLRLQAREIAIDAAEQGPQAQLHRNWKQLGADVAWIQQQFSHVTPFEGAYSLNDVARHLRDREVTAKRLEQLTADAYDSCLRLPFPTGQHPVDHPTLADKLLEMHARLADARPCDYFKDHQLYRLVKAAANAHHEAATGDFRIYASWHGEEVMSGQPIRLPTEIDLMGCVRAARFLTLEHQLFPVHRFVYGSEWTDAYKAAIPLRIRLEDLTPAEIARLKDPEPNVKPEWAWLPGLQEAAEAAVMAPEIKRELKANLPPPLNGIDALTSMMTQYAGNNADR